jgi:hypothetical protein
VPGRTDARGEWCPPVLEAFVLDADFQDCLFNLVKARGGEQSREVSPPRADEPGFVADVRVLLPRSLPEGSERTMAAALVPDAGGHDAARTGHARHLAHSGDGLRKEMHHELCERRIEGSVGEGQLLRTGVSHVDPRMSCSGGRYEQFRRVDCRDCIRSQSPGQLPGERSRSAADIDGSLAGVEAVQVRELRRELNRVSTHESVIRVGGDVEAHPSSVEAALAPCHRVWSVVHSAINHPQ